MYAKCHCKKDAIAKSKTLCKLGSTSEIEIRAIHYDLEMKTTVFLLYNERILVNTRREYHFTIIMFIPFFFLRTIR